jgi:hypothetical protein
MNNVDYYRKQYMHCADQAASAADTQSKADWLKLAMDWLALIPEKAKSGNDNHAAERLEKTMAALAAPRNPRS